MKQFVLMLYKYKLIMFAPSEINSEHKTKVSIFISSFHRRAMYINKWIVKVIILLFSVTIIFTWFRWH